MPVDITFHYPPELMALLKDAIPALTKSKMDVILLLKGAGVGPKYLGDVEQQVRTNKDSIGKHAIVQTVLARLNEAGEAAIRERREILRRVVEFDDFSVCWENQHDIAKARVADIRQLVNVKDSFTRMKMEREHEHQKRQEETERKGEQLRRREQDMETIRRDFAALFVMTDPWKRGNALESLLNRLFKWYGVSIREPFTIRTNAGGAIEQIDGVIALELELYLVEIKWWSEALGPGDVSQHLVRVFNRGQARGIFIAQPGYTEAAVLTCKESLQRAVFVLADLPEVFLVVEGRHDLVKYLVAKVHGAIAEKDPYKKPPL